MEEVVTYKSYDEFKKQLDEIFEQQAESFVKAGYRLKIARDTEILEESGYKSVAEFAQKEYGFTKDLVSRYIAINDRFSMNGYSEQLEDKYKGFGFSKLSEMLSLPNSIIEEISSGLTRTQIQELKREVKEETLVSDIEVMCEEKKEKTIECRTTLEKVIYEFMKTVDEKMYKNLIKAAEQELTDEIFEILAPSGCAALTARVPGEGKYMISLIKGSMITITNIRNCGKMAYTDSDLVASLKYMYSGKRFYDVYPELKEEKVKVAPVQPTLVSGADKKESELEEKVTKNDNMTVETKEILTEKEFFPEPVQLNSICYKCEYNAVCGQKSTITTECNEYVNKAEAEKTEEQKYSEQQDAIDKQTEKVLQQRADEEKLEHFPSEHDLHKVHEIKIAHEYFDDVALERKTFELRKNNRDYKVGDELHMIEYENGEQTGRELAADIIYMIEDYSGLEEGYCILGIDITMAKEREDN